MTVKEQLKALELRMIDLEDKVESLEVIADVLRRSLSRHTKQLKLATLAVARLRFNKDRLSYLTASLNLARAERSPDLQPADAMDPASFTVDDLTRGLELIENFYTEAG